MRRIRPISHEDRLSVVEHLDELRTRLIICGARLRRRPGRSRPGRTTWSCEIVNAPAAATGQIEPITLGPAEAFYTTLTNSAYAALMIALPVILYQLYAFILPAFSPSERRVATPLLLMVPVLFIAGVVFCYFVVLTPALHFLLNFNADEFNTQVRARDYYSFVTLLMLAMGLGLPDTRRDPRRLQARPHQRREAAQEPPLRDRRDRGPGVAPAHARPAHADPRDDPALSLLYELSILARGSVLGRPVHRDRPTSAAAEGVASLRRRMLFDLRGRRRRAVQVTYLMLAAADGRRPRAVRSRRQRVRRPARRLQGQRRRRRATTARSRSGSTRQEERLAANPQNAAVLKTLVRDYYPLATVQQRRAAPRVPGRRQGRAAQGRRATGSAT